MKNKICLALDVDNTHDVRRLVQATRNYVGLYKVGLELFTAVGSRAIHEILDQGGKVFLDLKYHDIPTTVKKAAIAATREGVSILNVHTMGGTEMMKVTADAVAEEAIRLNIPKPLVLGVTILTSMTEQVLQGELGIPATLNMYVRKLANQAKGSGLDGIVCSPLETASIKQMLGQDFICLNPGIRPSWAEANDQKRVTTPREAIDNGADYIVIGRPITHHADPAAAAYRILKEVLGKETDELEIGDIVQPADPMDVLASGCGRYPNAVVIQTDPLVLVSRGTDMRWEHTIQEKKFDIIDKASDELLNDCMRRLIS